MRHDLVQETGEGLAAGRAAELDALGQDLAQKVESVVGDVGGLEWRRTVEDVVEVVRGRQPGARYQGIYDGPGIGVLP